MPRNAASRRRPVPLRVERDAAAVLQDAVFAGVLSGDPSSPRYVERYLYRFHDEAGVAWLRDRRTGAWLSMTPARAARVRA